MKREASSSQFEKQTFEKAAKKEPSTAKAEVVEALKKGVAKAAGVAEFSAVKQIESSTESANKSPKKSSPKFAEWRKRKSEQAVSVETPKEVDSAIPRVNREIEGSNSSSPPNAISASTQKNKADSATPPSDVQYTMKKKKYLSTKRSPKQENLAAYTEELLYELSCLELAESEYLFPFKSSHTRRLINREVGLVRGRISFSSPTKSLSHLHAAPSPGVLRLTVFPEELIDSSANSNSIVNNLLDGTAGGGYGDVSLVGQLPRNLLSANCGQKNNDRFSPFVDSFTNGLTSNDVMGFPIDGNRMFRKSRKIYIPEHPSYNFIGRILGPRGNSVRRLEALTGCTILIRGKGSVKDPVRELKLRKASGWEHLKDALHVSITAEDANEHVCNMKLHRASANIQRLLTPMFDDYKRHQLIQLAIINGTYRP